MTLCFCVAASAQTPFTKKEGAALFRDGKSAVLYNLKDPKSAEFRNLFIGLPRDDAGNNTSDKVLCGELNAKNSMGGFSGQVRFYAIKNFAFIEGSESVFDTLYFRNCNDKFAGF